ncbi:MAG: hypothetical protein GKS01_13295 [Alphaproteobacteria bacterium]|nr:hypothetical protein [Alphaproteobacteria bacterium]
MNDTTPDASHQRPRSGAARTFWAFIIAPAVGPLLVLAIDISTETYSNQFLDNWRFDAMINGAFTVIPCYLVAWLAGIPAHRYARRQDIILSGWRGLLLYSVCGAVGGIVAFAGVARLFDLVPDIIGQNEFLAAILMGIITGLCLWFMAVWRNPDFGYVGSSAPTAS